MRRLSTHRNYKHLGAARDHSVLFVHENRAAFLFEIPLQGPGRAFSKEASSGAKLRLDKPPVNLAFRIARVYATDSQEVESKDFHSFGFFTI